MNETEARAFITQHVNVTLRRYAAIAGLLNLAALGSFTLVVLEKTKERVTETAKTVATEYMEQKFKSVTEMVTTANERLEKVHKFSEDLYSDVGLSRGTAKLVQKTLDDMTTQTEKMQERLTRVSQLDEKKIDLVLNQLKQGDPQSLLTAFATISGDVEDLKKQIAQGEKQTTQELTRLTLLESSSSKKIEEVSGQLEKRTAQGEVRIVSLEPGWSPNSDTNNHPAYFKTANGVVYLQGVVKRDASQTVIFTLLPGFKPAKKLLIVCNAQNGPNQMDIYPDGQVVYPRGSSTWVSLDGISFPAGVGDFATTDFK